MSVKLLDVPVHKARILLVNTRKDALELVKGPFYADENERQDSLQLMRKAVAISLESDGSVGWHLLYSRKKPQDIAHEAVHIGMMVLDNLGITITPENDETLAYLVDHIVEAFYAREGWMALDEFLTAEAPAKKAKRG